MSHPRDDGNIAVLEAIETALNTGKGKQLDDRGRELLDPRPVAPPVGYKRQPSMVEHIRNMVRSEMLRSAAENAGMESFEDADDFVVGDDYDPASPYEGDFEPVDYEALKAQEARDAKKASTPPENQGTRPEGGEKAPTPPPAPDASGSKTGSAPNP